MEVEGVPRFGGGCTGVFSLVNVSEQIDGPKGCVFGHFRCSDLGKGQR